MTLRVISQFGKLCIIAVLPLVVIYTLMKNGFNKPTVAIKNVESGDVSSISHNKEATTGSKSIEFSHLSESSVAPRSRIAALNISRHPRPSNVLYNHSAKLTSQPTVFKSTTKTVLNSAGLQNARSRNVFYNRLGKCGSRSLLTLTKAISRLNNITTYQSSNFWDDHPNDALVLEEVKKIAKLKPPTFYNRHIHYLDFEKYGVVPPIYINVIRDPISRYMSQFNYAKYGDSLGGVKNPPKNLSHINQCVMNDEPYCRRPVTQFYYTNYFCGFDPVCNDTSPQKKVELAKKHIDENYFVIGMTEEFENTLQLLEKMLPAYFKHAYTWKRSGRGLAARTKSKTKDTLSEEATKKLRNEILWYEYEVYHHAKAKYEKLKDEQLNMEYLDPTGHARVT